MKKPIGQYEIDWSHPLSKGLEFFYVSSSDEKDYADNKPYDAKVGTPIQSGNYSYFSNSRIFFQNRNPITSSGRTVVSKIRLDNNTSYKYVVSTPTEGGYTLMLAANNAQINIFWKGLSGYLKLGSSLLPNVWYTICGIKSGKAVADAKIYRDKTYIGSGGHASSPSGFSNWQINIGGRSDRLFHGDIEFSVIWSRDLTEEEYLSFESDPYQILKPTRTIAQEQYAALFHVCPDVYVTTPPAYHVGAFILHQDGSFDYTFDGTADITEDYFEFYIKDEQGTTNTARITLKINPDAADDNYTFTAGASLVVSAELGVFNNDTYECGGG